MFDPVDGWAEKVEESISQTAFQRDPDFLKRLLPWMAVMRRYFDADVRDLERVPDGPVLLVGNHSGGVLTPDTTALIHAWYREFGLERPLLGLALDAAFAIPGFGSLMRRIGQIPASMENARRALATGAAVLVYPGGDYEVYRPWTERNRIEFNGHVGFIRLAIEQGVPVVPVVGHGGHDSMVVLARGDALAHALGLDRLRVHMFPLLWQLPWGLTLGGVPGIPLPAKVTLQVCAPLDWTRYGPEQADDPRVLKACYEEITRIMQTTLDALAEERPHPVWSRVRSLLPGAPPPPPPRSRRRSRRPAKRKAASKRAREA